MSVLLAALLWAGLPQEVLLADQRSGNGLASCLPREVDRKGSVLLRFSRRNVGREIHIEHEASGRVFNLVLTGRAQTEWSGLEGKDSFLLDLARARGIDADGKGPRPVFVRAGTYTIWVGYGFRAEDEGETYGVCQVTLK
ncbi:hypothetical protein FHW96_000470 [Novosphingobium sp. SG751A]|uniref:hypothetical protein n=1 Tax=Novosphingobium sp. SG751A TaxID=2587000 RepID=UPI0015571471|nr:hypothetical protein [Novosphingobium sp. SG751A]NOW44343.1 hypothetical protein [Novosphingobium sp. SG751A]